MTNNTPAVKFRLTSLQTWLETGFPQGDAIDRHDIRRWVNELGVVETQRIAAVCDGSGDVKV